MMASADEFRITVKGKPSHGSTPEGGVNAVSIAAAIITAAQQMMTLEFSCDDPTVLAFCKLNAGTAANIIPEDAEIMAILPAAGYIMGLISHYIHNDKIYVC